MTKQAKGPRPALSNPPSRRGVGALLVLALVLGWGAWSLLRPHARDAVAQKEADEEIEPARAQASRAPADEQVELEPDAAAPAQPSTAAAPTPMSAEEAHEKSLEHARRSLQLYQDTMVFPPWSRPYDGSTRHLVDWNQPWPVGQPFAADKSRREIRADVTLDKLYAGPGEALTASLSVAYVDTGDATDPDALSGRVEWYDAKTGEWQLAADVPFVQTKPGQYRATFTPSSIAALSALPHEPRFMTHLKLGDFFKDLPQTFQYSAKEVFAVRSLVADRIEQGSLEVVLAVDVSYQAPTLVQAALFDANGKVPIAVYDDYYRPPGTGRAQLTLRFFGKAIREKGTNGPYSVRALHGHVKVPSADPPEVFWAHADSPALLTRAYSASQFSDAAWSSPEKAEKIEQYVQMISELERK